MRVRRRFLHVGPPIFSRFLAQTFGKDRDGGGEIDDGTRHVIN